MAFRSVGTGTTATNTAPTTNAPAGVATGDIVVQFIWTNDIGTTITWASGFTLIVEVTGTAPNRDAGKSQLHAAWKLATGSEPGTYVNSVSGSVAWQGFAACWSGRNGLSPITASNTTNASGTVSPVTYALNGVTAAANDDLIWFPSEFGGISGTAVWTPPSGFTSRISYQPAAPVSPGQNLSTQDAVSAGATGTLTGTETGQDGDIVGLVIALANASGGGVVVGGSVNALGPGVSPDKRTTFRLRPLSAQISPGTLIGVGIGYGYTFGQLTGSGTLSGLSNGEGQALGSLKQVASLVSALHSPSPGITPDIQTFYIPRQLGLTVSGPLSGGISFSTGYSLGALTGTGALTGLANAEGFSLGALLPAGGMAGLSFGQGYSYGQLTVGSNVITISGIAYGESYSQGILTGVGALAGGVSLGQWYNVASGQVFTSRVPFTAVTDVRLNNGYQPWKVHPGDVIG